MASIIERNIKKMGNKFLENIEYEDVDYRGFLDEGQSPTIRSGAVLVNDLKLWLQSSRGDYYRRWSMGGYFDTNLRRFPLSDEGASDLQEDLQSTIEKQFPTIRIIDINVAPLMQRRGWKVRLVIQDKLTGAMAPVEAGIPIPE